MDRGAFPTHTFVIRYAPFRSLFCICTRRFDTSSVLHLAAAQNRYTSIICARAHEQLPRRRRPHNVLANVWQSAHKTTPHRRAQRSMSYTNNVTRLPRRRRRRRLTSGTHCLPFARICIFTSILQFARGRAAHSLEIIEFPPSRAEPASTAGRKIGTKKWMAACGRRALSAR